MPASRARLARIVEERHGFRGQLESMPRSMEPDANAALLVEVRFFGPIRGLGLGFHRRPGQTHGEFDSIAGH